MTSFRAACARLVAAGASLLVPRLLVPASLLAAACLGHSPLSAQGPPSDTTPAADDSRAIPMSIPRISGPIELDGIVNEPYWDEVEPLPMTVFSPTHRGPLTETTEIRVAHDNQFLYVSGRLYDSSPEEIRTNTFYRDRYSGDDALAVIIDSYNDHENAVWFVTNPAGSRTDRTVFADGQPITGGGPPMNEDWNSYWEVATSQGDEGWFAEFRIPFSTLGFQALDDEVTMGLIAYRMVARKNERQTFPDLDPQWGGIAFAKPSQAQRIILRGVRQTKPLYVTPYALGGVSLNPILVDGAGGAESFWDTERERSGEAGLDIKYSPTSNLALNVTVNTDFAQVEADSAQVNIERFPLFVPEKRQFFQERSATFDFNTGGPANRLFHSRQIGLDQGRIVRIYGGVRAVGRVGGTDFGLLNMQTAAHGNHRSSENMGVLRLRQQVLNPYSTMGAMVTSRLGSHGEDNVAYGLDASIRVVGDEYAEVQWAQTFDEALAEAGALEAGLLRVRWQRRREAGLTYRADFARVGSEYTPGLGFHRRLDYTYGAVEFGYAQFMDANSVFQSRGLGITARQFIRNSDKTAESREINPMVEGRLKGGARLDIGMRSLFESVREPFPIADVEVVAGEYWFHEAVVNLRLSRTDTFRGNFSASAGGFYDGSRLNLSVGPIWNVSRFLELGATWSINQIDFPERNMATTTHLGQLKIESALNTHLSLSVFAQYSGVDNLATFNSRLRYHFSEGTDLWIVYNEGLHTDRDENLIARTPLSSGRAVSIKYTRTFVK